MLRNIIVKTEGGHAALSARMRLDISQEEFLKHVQAALRDFQASEPEAYQDSLIDNKFPWSRLYTHVPTKYLMGQGIDLTEFREAWLEIPDEDI